MTVTVVVQARTGSSRFPAKVLTEIRGQTMLGFMLDRLIPLTDDPGHSVVVATSDSPSDDAVAAIATTKGMAAVRGSEQDVLARFGKAIAEHPADVVVRLTADCPLMDPTIVRAVLAEHASTGSDYTSNTLARTFPDGLDVEVVAADALRWADRHAERSDEREHVTPYLQRHPRSFQISQVLDTALAGDERWTVDRPDDLAIVRRAIEVSSDPRTARWTELLDRLGRQAPTTKSTATPVRTKAHRRGEPYHRQWTLGDPADQLGSALLVVDEGGTSTLTLAGPRRVAMEAAVRERLEADRQVTQLTVWESGVTT